ncbi:hypothetical protein EV284_3461 [Streptomyces sp. BK022]|uniref:hypothetical protein n=1 Tax=Streptomyces sp. BK022 TaxID=2512123 RepID=UPI00102997CF|nr:hypothetical protein [Streptomyces sp. BK022]RZU35978.1 hypothetical protein EV284_3461 [Streptomyces sp. BK022]
MTNRSKQKGTSFESSVLPAIKEKQPLAERRALEGKQDKGDFYIPGEDRFVIEAKNHKEMDLSGWLREATTEAANANVPHGVVFHKKRGTTDPREQYATMKVGTFLDLVYPEE